MGSIWEGFGRDFGPLGPSWAVLERLFSMLAFGVVFKSALGGIRAGFLRDLKGLGKILGGFWKPTWHPKSVKKICDIAKFQQQRLHVDCLPKSRFQGVTIQ